MRQVFFLELRRFLPALLVLNLIIGLGRELLGLNFILIATVVIPLVFTLVMNFSLRRTFWYLNLPGSRRKILASVGLQNAVMATVLGLNMSAWIFILEMADVSLAGLLRVIFLPIGCGLFPSLMGLFYRQRALVMPPQEYSFQKIARSLGILILLFIMFWNFGDEPLFLWAFLLAFLGFFIIKVARYEVLAPGDAQRLLAGAKMFLVVAWLAPLAVSVVLAHQGDLTNKWTMRAFDFLGRIPVFLSDARVRELYLNSKVGYPQDLKRRLDLFRTPFDQKLWQKRTEACQISECLDVSADVVELKATAPAQVLADFEILTQRCKFDFDRRGNVACLDLNPYRMHLASWLKRLREDGVLDRWLSEPSVKHKIFALHGLEKSPKTVLLEKDPNPLVARVAQVKR